MMHWRSLRWKIALLTAAASCAVTVVVGVLVHQSTFRWLVTAGENDAFQALGEAVAENDVTPKEEVPGPLRALLPLGGTHYWYDDRKPDQPWMWAGRLMPNGDMIAVQMDMGARELSLKALDRHIVMVALATLAVIVPVSALAAELPTRRLRRVAQTARRIADGDLDARIGGSTRSGDEIAEISAAVDSMAGSLQHMLLSEQRFTADVAHELRTPVMGLMTSAELLPEGESTDLVLDRVRVLRTLVEHLLEISRLDAGAERADLLLVPVGEVVAESVRRTGLQASVTVTGTPTVRTDPRRLDRIIANLVINAHRHGRAPVEVAVDQERVVVRDHGSGFPASLLEHGPQRFRTGDAARGRGHGLGLAIAAGQAQVIGASLELANSGGAVAVVRFGTAGRT
ncbi:ATP-binding protein [Nonomuraea typhae]|uniref:histidine kinase n=1 Tax=Nonomuraea typhae TaxID=2603600 RepID=A0ABW7YVW1_9ACTN